MTIRRQCVEVQGRSHDKEGEALECALPGYTVDRKTWRREILTCARRALGRSVTTWDSKGPFEVVALLYLKAGKQRDRHDVDNRLKDILDGLQGAFYLKAPGKKRSKFRLIKNDSSVCRAMVEKHKRPKKYANQQNAPGGRLLIRPYVKSRWPLQVVKAAKSVRLSPRT